MSGGERLVTNLAAQWAVGKMIVGGEQIQLIWSEEEEDGERESRYEQVDPRWLLALVLAPRRPERWARPPDFPVFGRLRWSRTACRHGVTRRSIRLVIARSGLRFTLPPPSEAAGASERLIFLGRDDRGRTLEVMAVETAGADLQVIHAMEMTDAYRVEWEYARRCLR